MAPTMKLAALNAAIRGLTPGVRAAPAAADDQDVDVSGLLSMLQGAQLGGVTGLVASPAGASCGCGPKGADDYAAGMDGFLPVAGNETTVAAAGAYSVTINVQGRPVKGSRLFMANSAGIFSATQIKLGNNDLQFGGYVAGFALNPANQNGNGIEIVAPDDWFNGLTTITISGNVSASAVIQAQLMSNDPSLYSSQSCGPVLRRRFYR